MLYTNKTEFTHENTDKFRILGRSISDETGLYFTWSNNGIEFAFKGGDRVNIHFGDYNCDAPVYVKVYVDGKTEKHCLYGKDPKIVIDGLDNAKHKILLLRISEGGTPLIFKKAEIYGKNPVLLAPPKEKKLRIEFIGDSITCGFGDIAPRSQDTYYTYQQDSTETYAYYTAKKLGAEIRTVCISGQGVYRNCSKEEGTPFIKIFDMSLRGKYGYDHSTWIPDVVVLNCGTNDVPGGTEPDVMYEEGGKLIDKVRSAYPTSSIIWIYGMMNDKFNDTLKKLVSDKKKSGDKKIYYLYFKSIYGFKNEVGAIGHPNANASERVSKKLAKYIEKILIDEGKIKR